MKIIPVFLRILAVADLAAAPMAFADFVGSPTFSGPGGSGTDGGTFGTTTEPRLQFTSMNYIDVTMTVDAAGNYDFNEAPGLGFVQNQTGVAWTAFDLQILSGGVGTFVNPPTSLFAWEDYPAGNLANFSSTDVYFPTENIPSGNSLALFGYFAATGAGTVTIRETPVAAPEPSALALAGMASMGLGFLRRRR